MTRSTRTTHPTARRRPSSCSSGLVPGARRSGRRSPPPRAPDFPLAPRPGAMVGTYDYVADTRYSWGGIAFPFGGGSRSVGIQVGTFGFKDQPVYTAEQPEGTGSVLSGGQNG